MRQACTDNTCTNTIVTNLWASVLIFVFNSLKAKITTKQSSIEKKLKTSKYKKYLALWHTNIRKSTAEEQGSTKPSAA